MDATLFFSLFFILCIIYISISFFVSKSVKSVEDYFLAGRNLGFFQISISLIATQLGGGFILGISDQAYKFGYYGLFYVFGICLGFMLLGFGIASKLRAFNVDTIAQLFEVYYDSKFLRKMASLTSILSLTGIFAAQIIGSKCLLVSLNLYNPILFIGLWFLIIVYAMLGGFKAIVQSDIIQLSLIILVFLSLFVLDLIFNFSQTLSVFEFGWTNPIFLRDIKLQEIVGIAIIPALYSLIEQDLAQVFFASKNGKLAKVSALFASVFLLFFALVPLYFGIKSRMLGFDIGITSNALITLFDRQYDSLVVVLVTYGVLAAIISTANGVLCAISSNIVKDFDLPKLSSSNQLILSKVVMFLVGIIGIILAFNFSDIIQVLIDSYSVPISSILISLLALYFYADPTQKNKIRFSKTAAYLSFFGGLITFLTLLFLKKNMLFSAEIDALLVSLTCYILGFLVDYFNRTKR